MRLVVSDLDGTLVVPGSTVPDRELTELIKALYKQGIAFAVNTGRQFSTVKPLFGDSVGDVYSICQNGGVIYHGKREICRNALDRLTALEIAARLSEIPETELMMSNDRGYFAVGAGEHNEIIRRVYEVEKAKKVVSAAEIDGDIIQITLFDFNDIGSRLCRVGDIVGGRAEYSVSSRYCIDISAGNKGSGVKELCEILNVPLLSVMCFGDSFNDLSMLSVCGVPYVMNDAPETLRRRFPRVTDNPQIIMRGLLNV